jgi:hypothetical protein
VTIPLPPVACVPPVQGLSFDSQSSADPARAANALRTHILAFQYAISAPERCPVPVIAAVHGVAYGLAIDIIAACDVRYAAVGATFSIKVCRRIYCMVCVCVRVPTAVGFCARAGFRLSCLSWSWSHICHGLTPGVNCLQCMHGVFVCFDSVR